MMVSVLILTLNEEINLPRCLESLKWSDDIVVLDSLSSDRTVEMARAAGARVVQRKFDNWSSHQNWAVQNIPFKHPWVYYSDADEEMPPPLRDEILRVTGDTQRTEVAYRLRFRNFFMGRWLKHSSLYPTWVLRLFRPDHVRWERLVNPVPVVDGPEGKLQEHFLHYSFNKGLTAWFTKHNAYSGNEAREGVKVMAGDAPILRGIFSRQPATRRAAMKDLSFRIPFRGMCIYLYLMFAKFGILDGPPGWLYCRMRAHYEFMIAVKMYELRMQQKGISP